MKLLHLSDLHLGKRFKEASLLPDQAHILLKILEIIDREKPDAVLIAGDVYDKSVPPAEAVQLFDDFLVRLSARGLPVFIISGNHDSAERLAFGGRLMAGARVYFSPVYDGQLRPISLADGEGTVDFWLLPFLKPVQVRRFFPDETVESSQDAVAAVLSKLPLDPGHRNVLLAHLFVTGAERSESEELSVGGSDNVDAARFRDFDYVALGHLHAPQNVSGERVRYCGTPLKYSFSEAEHVKSVSVIELGKKGERSLRTVPLEPLHDLRRLRGSYLELSARSSYEGTAVDDYLQITLTDEEEIPEAMAKLRLIYPNLLSLDYDNRRSRSAAHLEGLEEPERRSPLELFEEFYEKQNNQPMSERQRDYVRALMESIEEERA